MSWFSDVLGTLTSAFEGDGQAVTRLRQERAARDLQRGYRALLAQRGSEQARRNLIDERTLALLASVCRRSENRAALNIQKRFRARVARRLAHHERQLELKASDEAVAVSRIHGAMHRRRASQAAGELQRQAARELAELNAAIVLQAALRRNAARKRSRALAQEGAMGLLRQQWGANREVRSVGFRALVSRPSTPRWH